MKKKIILLGILIAAGFVGYRWGIERLHQRIEIELSMQLNRHVYIRDIELQLPFDLYLQGVRIFEKAAPTTSQPRFLEMERLTVRPNLLSWMWGKIVIDHIQVEKAKLYLVRNPDGTLNVSDMLQASSGKGSSPAKTTDVTIKAIDLMDGEIVILDNALADPNGLQTALDRVELHLRQLQWPIRPTTVTHFSLSSRMNPGGRQQESVSRIILKGWINWLRRDLQANLEVKDLDVAQFNPYLKGDAAFFSNLESCKIQFSSEAKSTENVLTATCRFRMSDVTVNPENSLDGKLFGIPSATIWQWFERSGKGANLEVFVKGHLQPFRVSSVNFSTDFMKSAIASSIPFKVQQIAEKGQEVIQEGGERLGKAADKTGIPKAVQKIGKAAEDTKDSIQELLP
jgi:hypothetical protein